MEDNDGSPMFAFHDLNYIPYGFGDSTAPYIETPAATMRAAATLMFLDLMTDSKGASTHQAPARTVVCDLGCGDGHFLISLLGHINTPSNNTAVAHGVGIDFNAELIESAGASAQLKGVDVQWLIYDFNADHNDIVSLLLITHLVTHVFLYLVPKQLALPTVRHILTRLCKSGVVVCCYKFHPQYLTPARHNTLMELVVYDERS